MDKFPGYPTIGDVAGGAGTRMADGLRAILIETPPEYVASVG
jgi:hypothetical protein